jgi:hypothetical protein
MLKNSAIGFMSPYIYQEVLDLTHLGNIGGGTSTKAKWGGKRNQWDFYWDLFYPMGRNN